MLQIHEKQEEKQTKSQKDLFKRSNLKQKKRPFRRLASTEKTNTVKKKGTGLK